VGCSISRAALDVALAELNSCSDSFASGSLFLRAASLASDERENVQNRRNTANVPRNTHEPIFHAGMPVCEGFNALANISQAINFQQKILEAAAITGPSAAEVIVSSIVLADTGLTST